MKRFMYWKPWGVTRPWMPSLFRGCDEWHNKSVALKLPMLGCLIFFWDRGFNRDGEEHLWYQGPDGREGYFDPTCDICKEIDRDMTKGV